MMILQHSKDGSSIESAGFLYWLLCDITDNNEFDVRTPEEWVGKYFTHNVI